MPGVSRWVSRLGALYKFRTIILTQRVFTRDKALDSANPEPHQR